MMRSLVGLFATLSISAAGCELTYDPEVGSLHPVPPDSGTADDGAVQATKCADSDPEVGVSFGRDLRPLFTSSTMGCMPCHGNTLTSGFSLGTYDSLRRGGATAGARVIVPERPCESVLVQKLSPFPPFGARMPFISGGSVYFSSAQLTLVSDWIAEGALNN